MLPPLLLDTPSQSLDARDLSTGDNAAWVEGLRRNLDRRQKISVIVNSGRRFVWTSYELTLKIQEIAAFLQKQGNFYASRIARKLRGNQRLSDVERAYVVRTRRGNSTVTAPTNDNPLDTATKTALRELSKKSPIFLWRTCSLGGGRNYKVWMPTNGFTSEDFIVPSKALLENRPRMRDDMLDIPQKELGDMVGSHLIWEDEIEDETLSFTSSFLFCVTHAYLRHLMGQTDCYLGCIDRRKTRKPTNWYTDHPGQQVDSGPASFYYAPALCDSLKLLELDWDAKRKGALHFKKFTHELIAQGVIEYSVNDVLRQVTLGDYVEGGLFRFLPELRVPSGEKDSGLYTVLRYLRTTILSTETPCTDTELEIAENLARLHTGSLPHEKPHLWVFMHLVSLRMRGADDEIFRERIKHYGYTRADLDEGLYEDYEKVPVNLPERISLNNLLRNVQAVVGGEEIKKDIILREFPISADHHLGNVKYMSFEDNYQSERRFPPLLTVGEEEREKFHLEGICDLSCRCSKSRRKKVPRKRKVETSQEEDGGNNGDDNLNNADASNGPSQKKIRMEDSHAADTVQEEQVNSDKDLSKQHSVSMGEPTEAEATVEIELHDDLSGESKDEDSDKTTAGPF